MKILSRIISRVWAYTTEMGETKEEQGGAQRSKIIFSHKMTISQMEMLDRLQL